MTAAIAAALVGASRTMKKIGLSTSNSTSMSFTLTRLSGCNLDSIRRAGGLPIIIPSIDEAKAEAYIDQVDALVLTGGNDVSPHYYDKSPTTEEDYDFERDRFEFKLLEMALAKEIPIMCICRGLQLANVYMGGSLILDLKKEGYTSLIHLIEDQNDHRLKDAYHTIEVDKESNFYSLTGKESLLVNSIHHQVLGRLGDRIRPVAKSSDGIVEIAEMEDYENFIGFQFHPERMQDQEAIRKVYKDFVRRA